MKSILKIAVSTLLFGAFSANAQVSDECKKDASLGIENAKVKNYTAAEPYLLKVRQNCPTYSMATYQYSERLLRDKLSKATDKKAVANELIALLKERKQYFPAKTPDGDMISDIALLMNEYDMGTKMEQYEKFNEAYTKDKEHFEHPKKLYTFFVLLLELQEEGKKDVGEVFALYDDITDKIEVEESKMAEKIKTYTEKEESGQDLLSREKKSLERAEKNLGYYSQVKATIDKKLGKLADCDYLIPLFTKEYDAKKSDVNWVKRSARRMYKKECTKDPLFQKLVEQQHTLEPSAATANYLGKLAEENGKIAEARKYYEEAAEKETNPSRKADVYYSIALSEKKKGSYGAARKYFRKALASKPSMGSAYLQIANMIGNSANSCGSDTCSKLSVNWLAAQYASRAGRVDPSLKSVANKTASAYLQAAPSKTDVFNKGLQGKSVSIGCWIGESVKIPY